MNSPHGDPVEVSEVTDEADNTIVSPSSERPVTIVNKTRKAFCPTFGFARVFPRRAVDVRRAVEVRVAAVFDAAARCGRLAA